MAVEAKSKGQRQIQVHNYPARLDDHSFMELSKTKKYSDDEIRMSLWKNMKQNFDYFEKYNKLLNYEVNAEGKYIYSN